MKKSQVAQGRAPIFMNGRFKFKSWLGSQFISMCINIQNIRSASRAVTHTWMIYMYFIKKKIIHVLNVFYYIFGFFMPPAWKVCQGHLVIGSSVSPFVCLSVRNSVPLTNKVQYLKFGWWYSNQTWTVSSSMGSSHFTDITCPWGLVRVKM